MTLLLMDKLGKRRRERLECVSQEVCSIKKKKWLQTFAPVTRIIPDQQELNFIQNRDKICVLITMTNLGTAKAQRSKDFYLNLLVVLFYISRRSKEEKQTTRKSERSKRASEQTEKKV